LAFSSTRLNASIDMLLCTHPRKHPLDIVYRPVCQVPHILHFEPFLGALSLLTDVISSMKNLSRQRHVYLNPIEWIALAFSSTRLNASIDMFLCTPPRKHRIRRRLAG